MYRRFISLVIMAIFLTLPNMAFATENIAIETPQTVDQVDIIAQDLNENLVEHGKTDTRLNDSKKIVNYLIDNGVSQEDIIKLIKTDPEMLFNLWQEASAMDYTPEQINQYIEGLICTPTEIIADTSKNNKSVKKDTYGNIIAPDGSMQPDTVEQKLKYMEMKRSDYANYIREKSMNAATTGTSFVETIGVPNDATGTYYVVKARSGYHLATQSVKLPKLSTVSYYDHPYVMWGVYNSKVGGDYGVYYSRDDNQWHGFYNTVYNNPHDQVIDTSPNQKNSTPINPETEIYMYCYITSNGYVRVRIVDRGNFSKVYYDVSVWQRGHTIPTNSDIYKQVTIAQFPRENGGIVKTDTGTKMMNAKIWDSYLYSNTETVKWNPNNVWQIARISQTSAKAANTVTVSTLEKWSSENVSIHFDY